MKLDYIIWIMIFDNIKYNIILFIIWYGNNWKLGWKQLVCDIDYYIVLLLILLFIVLMISKYDYEYDIRK